MLTGIKAALPPQRGCFPSQLAKAEHLCSADDSNKNNTRTAVKEVGRGRRNTQSSLMESAYLHLVMALYLLCLGEV